MDKKQRDIKRDYIDYMEAVDIEYFVEKKQAM